MGSFNKTKNECSTSSEKKEPAVLKSTSSEILPSKVFLQKDYDS